LEITDWTNPCVVSVSAAISLTVCCLPVQISMMRAFLTSRCWGDNLGRVRRSSHDLT
jgi:hypothetical protein